MTSNIENKIQVFVNRCLRRILKIRWPETISNEALWKATRTKNTWIKLKERILVNTEDWNHIWSNGRLKTNTYIDYFVKKIIKFGNISCVLKSNGNYGKSVICIRLDCSYIECKAQYKLMCNPSNIEENCRIFSVFYSGGKIEHNAPGLPGITRHLKGAERARVAEILKKQYPRDYRDMSIENLSKDLYYQGNMQDVKSDEVLRQIRFSKLHEQDLHKDDCEDMRQVVEKQRNKEPGYIDKYVQQLNFYPFAVYAFSDEQINVLVDVAKRDPDLTAHFDATGSVVREVSEHPIYYYAQTIPLRNYFPGAEDEKSSLYAIMEMITDSHSGFSIEMLLRKFKNYFKKQHPTKWPIIKHVVTDFSFAMINAISEGWNDVEVIDYINLSFDFINDKSNSDLANTFLKFVRIHLCCCHFMKTIAKDVDKDFPSISAQNRHLLKEIIAGMFDMSDYNQMKSLWLSFSYLLHCPKNNEKSEAALREISKSIVYGTYTQLTEEEEEEEYRLVDDKKKELSQYAKSKFYKDFKQLNPTTVDESGTTENPFYNKTFAEKFLRKYVSILPLWTALLSPRRKSNAVVEIYFKLIKSRLIQNAVELGLPPLKCSKFLKETRKYINARSTEYLLQVPKKRCTNSKRNLKKLDVDTIAKKIKKRVVKKIICKNRTAKNKISKERVSKKRISKKSSLPIDNEKSNDVDLDNQNQNEIWKKHLKSPHSYFNAKDLSNILTDAETNDKALKTKSRKRKLTSKKDDLPPRNMQKPTEAVQKLNRKRSSVTKSDNGPPRKVQKPTEGVQKRNRKCSSVTKSDDGPPRKVQNPTEEVQKRNQKPKLMSRKLDESSHQAQKENRKQKKSKNADVVVDVDLDHQNVQETWFRTPTSSLHQFRNRKQISSALKAFVPRKLIDFM